MTIFIGGERYDVSERLVSIRGKEFGQVTLNDEPLGFTTELGKQWEAWMVVRELYSNALDENGSISTRIDSDDLAGGEDETFIVLRGDCFLEVWEKRHEYFLKGEPVYLSSPFVDVHLSPACCHGVFFRGIRVHQSPSPFLYRYNLKDEMTLTEDRTLKYSWQMKEAIEKAIITSSNAEFIERVLTCGENFFEGDLAFTETYSSLTVSEAFASVCKRLADRKTENVNARAIRWYKNRTQYVAPVHKVELTRVQQKQLDKAVACVRKLGYESEIDLYPIEVLTWLGENVYGQAKDGKILLSKDCFDKGTKFLTSTLFEEFVHNHYGLYDETRGLQTWLFDRIITMAEEHILGEPV